MTGQWQLLRYAKGNLISQKMDCVYFVCFLHKVSGCPLPEKTNIERTLSEHWSELQASTERTLLPTKANIVTGKSEHCSLEYRV